MEEVIERTIQQQVQLQLTEKGEYSPMELLIARGRLLYVDYEAWRRGRLDSLDQVLIGKRADISALLKQAETFSVRTGLIREPHQWTPWVDQNDLEVVERSQAHIEGQLNVSDHSELEQLLCCRFNPPRHQLQLDLFYDNVAASLENRVVQAFASRSLGAVDEALSELYASDPSHPELGQFDHLKRYLKHCCHAPCTPAILPKEFVVLSEKIVPIAHAALKSRARDFLVFCWMRLIDVCAALEPEERPASVSLSRLHWEVGDWQGVVSASDQELKLDLSLDLLVRRALAFDRLHRLANSYQDWFLISLLYPAVFSELVNEQPDDQLRTLWGDFEVWVEEQSRAGDVSEASELVAPEYESGQSRTAPGVALKAELYFPAFCLLKRRGLVQQMAEQLITDDLALEGSEQSEEGAEEEGVLAALQPALQLYTTLHQLIQVDSTENTDLTPDHAERSIALRKQLSDLSLPLMRLYLELS